MKRFFEIALKTKSTSSDDSLKALQHFGGILDHCVKIVTTIGLLVGLQIIWQKHESYLSLTLYWFIATCFLFYGLRLVEHCLIFFIENRTEIDPASTYVRWSVGIISFIANLSFVMYGSDILTKFVEVDFLQGG